MILAVTRHLSGACGPWSSTVQTPSPRQNGLCLFLRNQTDERRKWVNTDDRLPNGDADGSPRLGEEWNVHYPGQSFPFHDGRLIIQAFNQHCTPTTNQPTLHTTQCSAVQCSAVQCCAVQCCAVQCCHNTVVQWSATFLM